MTAYTIAHLTVAGPEAIAEYEAGVGEVVGGAVLQSKEYVPFKRLYKGAAAIDAVIVEGLALPSMS
jgi:uncharacterized protein (DUF1330 family)